MPRPASFPRFPELPLELQSQIWRYAATPDGFLESGVRALALMEYLRGTLEQNFFFVIRPRLIDRWTPEIYRPNNRHSPVIARARLAMMSTCCTARQIALQMWKRDVESIHIGRSGQQYGLSELRNIQVQTILLLDKLIE